LQSFLCNYIRNSNKKVVAYGGGWKGKALLNHLNIYSTMMDCVLDEKIENKGEVYP
jgi:hypothetical protein